MHRVYKHGAYWGFEIGQSKDLVPMSNIENVIRSFSYTKVK